MRRHVDMATPDMFAAPLPAQPIPGSHDYRSVIAGLVGQMLHKGGKDRFAIAAEMSRLTGKEVSKYMLDAYSAESREEYNLPLYLVPALEVACGTHEMTTWLAHVRGARIYVGRDALQAELGKLETQHEQIKNDIREMKRKLGEDA